MTDGGPPALTWASVSEAAAATRALAARALATLPSGGRAHDIARGRARCPIDYMRWAEYAAVLHDLDLPAGSRVLDVASPQWLSLYLAARHPAVRFHYVNLVDDELAPYHEIARALGLHNLHFHHADARALPFAGGRFDRCLSVSVIEHVVPEVGGDQAALAEVRRVLRPAGRLLMTVPYKARGGSVFVDGPVWDRPGSGRNFFAREYDRESFAALLDATRFRAASTWFICEKEGLLAADYHEWGPGRGRPAARWHRRLRAWIERVTRRPSDGLLARRYLRVGREVVGRVVNVGVDLTPI